MPGGRTLCLLASLLLAPALAGATSYTIAATVYFDTNGNGRRDEGEPGVPEALVSDGDRLNRTDADGRVLFEAFRPGDEPCRVFVIVPGAHRATSPWQVLLDPAGSSEQAVAFGLQPLRPGDEAPLAVTGDPRVSVESAERIVGRLLAELASPVTPPAAVVVLGALTAAGRPAELAAWRRAVATAGAPVYEVFSAHDGQATEPPSLVAFESLVGPAWFAFWAGRRCCVALACEPGVLTGLQEARQWRWVRRLAAALKPGTELVLLGHVPPAQEDIDRLRGHHRVRAVLYAHWRENAVWFHDEVPFLGTGPFEGQEWGAGTASFRRVTFTDTEVLAPVVTSGVRRMLQVLAPTPLQPPTRLGLAVRVAAYDSREPVARVEAVFDDREPLALRPADRFTWRLDLPAAEARRLKVIAWGRSGENWSTTVDVPPVAESVRPDPTGQPPRPPLQRAWLTPTGVARVTVSTPLWAEGKLLLAAPDEDLPGQSAVLAVDPVRGTVLWRTPTAGAIRGALAAGGGRLFGLTSPGVVQAFDTGTGRELWAVDLIGEAHVRQRSQLTGVTLWQGRLLAQTAGGELVALDPRTGLILRRLPVSGARWAQPAEDEQHLLVPTSEGLLGLAPATFETVWRTGDPLDLIRHGPVTLAGGQAFCVGEQLLAFDLPGGRIRWQRPLPTVGLTLGAVTVADGVVYTPGPRPLAFRAATGGPVWEAEPFPGPATGAPVVTADRVWATGDDGLLSCFERTTGQAVARLELGFPIKSAPLLVGNTLYLVDAAGNLHALVGR